MSTNPPSSPFISLACVEVSRFRRLSQARIEIDQKTTVLVGANNSGKTSLMIAIRNFLAEKFSFRAFDISLDQWPALRELSKDWEDLDNDPTTDGSDIEKWESQLKTLIDCMPTLDLWFDAKPGAYHIAAPFITTLNWNGGPVGIRLRLEPASSVEDLQKLAWRYRETRKPVKDLDKNAHAWPTDIIDYWLRHPSSLGKVAIYKLDPALGPMSSNPTNVPQPLSSNASTIDRTKLTKLLRIDFVPAQRGFGAEEADISSGSDSNQIGLFSNQLLKYARQHLNVTSSGQEHHPALVSAIATAQQQLDSQVKKALTPSIENVKKLGYPTLHDPQEIHFRTRIKTGDLLDHSTAVQYCLNESSTDEFLPEYSIGLGYQNLQSLSFQLVYFRESRLKPTEGNPAAVHIVMIEEPEAHLHVQVQRIFPQRATELITPSTKEHPNLSSQLIISTHASHLAHAENFDRIRYVKRLAPTSKGGMASSEIINLADAFGEDKETRTFAERYFRVQHTDLLFADAAIFFEGTAERMLVPLFIQEEFTELNKRYISFLDIGGRHAHRLRPLVEKLGIPTVIITDIDPVKRGLNESEKEVRVATPIDDPNTLECGNDTLNAWHPKLTLLHLMSAPNEEQLTWSNKHGGKVRFSWQLPVSEAGPWPSSFEDSLILSNIDWFKALATPDKLKELRGPLKKVVKTIQDHPDNQTLCQNLHEILHKNFNKGDFAATMFEKISSGEKVTCPSYISNALSWLEKEVNPAKDAPENKNESSPKKEDMAVEVMPSKPVAPTEEA